ncbi:trans-sialidase, putative, partial [Trypanosoma cruzi]
EVNEKEKEKARLHLWLSDNTHIADIGPVSGKEEDVAASSLLYKSGGSDDNNEEKLIALYEKKDDIGRTSGMVSVRLTEQLQRVKKVLATWKEVDERISKLCATLLAQEDTSPGNARTTDGKITDGLVGFLSGNFSENTWRDEYLGVNATVNNKGGAAKAEDGVTFQGAWAEWPVGRQGENQLYHFANHNFTLVATVSIDKVPKEDTSIPLLGAKMTGAGNSVFLGLSYGKEKKWQLLSGDETPKEHSSTLGTEKTQHVVILLRNGNQGSAYVDGKRVGSASWNLDNTDSKEISHFYIGGDGGNADDKESRGDVSVTVKNVLLYNRPLNDADISALNANKISIPKTMAGDTSSSAVSRPNRPAEDLAEGAKGEGTARDGGAHGDAGTLWGSRLLPSLLLLLGLWGFAAL